MFEPPYVNEHHIHCAQAENPFVHPPALPIEPVSPSVVTPVSPVKNEQVMQMVIDTHFGGQKPTTPEGEAKAKDLYVATIEKAQANGEPITKDFVASVSTNTVEANLKPTETTPQCTTAKKHTFYIDKKVVKILAVITVALLALGLIFNTKTS